jgi:hypothetical protein
MDIISDVNMNITFKDANNARHVYHTLHFVKTGLQDAWHLYNIVWINNQSMVADTMTKVLRKKVILRLTLGDDIL